MAKTKQDVEAFLNNLVGSIVVNKPNRDYDGQCVTLIKALLDFLGVSDPYAARGNAKDVGDALLRQGIAQPGVGEITIVINRDMGYIDGVRYGHIWVDLNNVANYESNGRQALHTTKNTRPISQGQQFVNLDKWLEDEVKITREQVRWHYLLIAGAEPSKQELDGYEGKEYVAATEDIKQYFANHGRGYNLYRQNAESKIKNLESQLAQKPKELIVEKPVEVIKEVEVPVEKIVEKIVEKEVIKSDNERSIGDLLSVVLKKLFNIK